MCLSLPPGVTVDGTSTAVAAGGEARARSAASPVAAPLWSAVPSSVATDCVLRASPVDGASGRAPPPGSHLRTHL
jgi:hypothetical protein